MVSGCDIGGRPRFRVISGGVDPSEATAATAGGGTDREGIVRQLLRKRDELTADADRLARRAHAVVDRIVALNRVIESYGEEPVADRTIVPIAGNRGNLP